MTKMNKMKTPVLTALAIATAVSSIEAFAASTNDSQLSGSYVLNAAGCAPFLNNNNFTSNNDLSPGGFNVGATIVIVANDHELTLVPEGDTSSFDKVSYRIGSISLPSESGSDLVETNQYLSDGEQFSHTAFDQEPGESIVITKTSDGIEVNVDGGAATCSLSAAQ